MDAILDWCAEHIGWTLVIALLFSGLIIAMAVKGEQEVAERMRKKCAPDPAQWDCQVYLAREGKASNESSDMMTGALLGGMLASSASR